jgi:hypothetical protein
MPDNGGNSDILNICQIYQTARRYNPEDSHYRARLLENLKSYSAAL